MKTLRAAATPAAFARGPARQRISAIMRKEMRHILRDWQTLAIVVAMPVVMMFLYGYALTLDITEVGVLVVDSDQSVESRALIRRVDATRTFRVVGVTPAAPDIVALFQRYHVKAIFRLTPTFARDLRSGSGAARVQVLIDGSDQNLATIVRNMSEPLVRSIVLDIINITPPDLIAVHPSVLYNPQQRSAFFFVPGLMAIILMMISALLTSLTVTREKELGTMEQLLVSPLVAREIIAGKILPYILLAGIDGALILFVGRYFFGVTVAGNPVLLAGVSLVYIFTALSMGLIVSTVAANQQQAMLMVLPVTLLPTIILSGFIFPLSSMPWFLQVVAHALPATYYLQLIRGIILKGNGIAQLWQPLLVLCGMGVLFFVVSVKRFRETL